MTTAESWTVGRLLQWTTDYLKQRGSTTPRLDAEVLLAQARGCQRIELYTAFNEETDEAQRATFRSLVKQRAEGTPVAYLVGQKEFFSLPLLVTPDVLIPRPETELLVTLALDRIKALGDPGRPVRIADVGTGSGAIAVAIAKRAPQVGVLALDSSPAALRVAAENVARHGVGDRVELLASDLFDSVPADAQFDLVLSNPPYVSEAEYANLAPEVRNYEPRAALVAGPTGVEVIQRLVPQAAARLFVGGTLALELSPMIADQVRALLESHPQFTQVCVVKDLAGLARIAVAQRGGVAVAEARSQGPSG